ncbi:peptidoglycan DD-metalloendopeptidase family protein [Rubrobacter indicoceani]|uniref:peptidoglycan DD-metalloendopeptidase family protein n=1 Tax=Rubrobacter indicoceani TaxID=2051957 RepID=UPI000E5C25F4|nr:peptidoglycan DD-metalloendopeptidase family protein [Rubrobacter indicoceani]
MVRFGWTRLAYLLVTLIMLALILKLGPMVASAVIPGTTLLEGRTPQPAGESPTEETPPENPTAETAAIPDTSETREERGESNGPERAAGSEERDHDKDHTAVSGIYERVDFREEAPVFYRPAAPEARSVEARSVASRSTGPPKNKVCKNVSAAPPGAKIVFPMTREYFDTYDDTWGAARPQGGHEGTDLMAEDGTPLLAMTDATVVPVAGANSNGWNTLGGYTVMLRADYSIGPVREGDLFYYAHMSRPANFRPGDTVEVGEVVGYVGDTGEGPEGTSGNFPSHLHLGWYDAGGSRSEVASGAMNPYPLLGWVKANGGSIKGGSDIPYCESPQPAGPSPSGGGSWPTPVNPGVTPDMDTGTSDPSPSPVISQNGPDARTTDKKEEAERTNHRDGRADAGENPEAVSGSETNAGLPNKAAGKAAPDGAVPGEAATAPPETAPPGDGTAGAAVGGSAQAGEAAGESPAITPDARNEPPARADRPLRGFWQLSREEKVQRLLELKKNGREFNDRINRWLDRALERGEAPDAQPPAEPSGPSRNPCETRPTEKDRPNGARETGCAAGDPAGDTSPDVEPENTAPAGTAAPAGADESETGGEKVQSPGGETPEPESAVDAQYTSDPKPVS